MEKMRVANEAKTPANDDILAVLSCLVSQAPCVDAAACAATSAGLESLDAFRLDHAHHPDRLPLLLRELAA